jgi:hypothetical protein
MLCANTAHAGTVFMAELGKTELQLEFDLYYTALGWYLPLASEPIPRLERDDEGSIYGFLLGRFLNPRFLVIEASCYPLPMLGTCIRMWLPDFYEWTTVFAGFNVIESLTTGPFMEPWAGSLFWGNVVDFTPVRIASKLIEQMESDSDTNGSLTNETDHPRRRFADLSSYEGKGYSGLLFTYGSHHIQHNYFIRDDWLEIEYKLKGALSSDRISLSWSYRLGGRIHFNEEIKSYIYIGLMREHLDMDLYRFMLVKNSFAELRLDFSTEPVFQAMKLTFIIGKKFPIRNSTIVPELRIGFIWYIADPYMGALAELEPEGQWQWIITPNIRF